jgi:hypothetical protein
MDKFTTAYIEAALWSNALDADFSPVQTAMADLLAPECLAQIEKDCAAFQDNPAWQAALDANAFSPSRYTGCSAEQYGGHDFWLTRNRHGAGQNGHDRFGAGNWKEPHGKTLTDIAHAFGEVYLYAGDDGRLYL